MLSASEPMGITLFVGGSGRKLESSHAATHQPYTDESSGEIATKL